MSTKEGRERLIEIIHNYGEGNGPTIIRKEFIEPLQARIDKLKAENQSFGDVLAVLHGDGGHYITKHGHKKASEDAMKIVYDLRAEVELCRWIPVEERPKKNEIVLWKNFNLESGPQHFGCVQVGTSEDFSHKSWKFSHWMNIPEAK